MYIYSKNLLYFHKSLLQSGQISVIMAVGHQSVAFFSKNSMGKISTIKPWLVMEFPDTKTFGKLHFY